MNFNNNTYNPAFAAINNQAQPMQQPVMEMKNVLSNEEMLQLQQQGLKGSEFFKAPSPIDTLRATCSHKRNGQLAVVPLGDGRYRCTVCGEEFRLVDPDDYKSVQVACDKVNDIFQSIKTYYGVSAPELRTIYPAINVIKQIPHMFKFASEYASRLMSNNNNQYYQNGYYNPSTLYSNITGAPIPGMDSGYQSNYGFGGFNGYNNPGYQQPSPVMNQQYPQGNAPGMNQNPAYGYPQQVQPQGINYVPPVAAPQYNPQQNYNPQNPQPGFTPNQQQNTMQNGQTVPSYSAVANPIGDGTPVQPQTAPAPVAPPTNTTNVSVGTTPVKFEA